MQSPQPPYISLTHVTLNPELVRRLPRRLAYYHLALPVAEDGGTITIALAHADHQAVVPLLRQILRAEVISVRADEAEIQAALDLIWRKVDLDSGSPGPARRLALWPGIAGESVADDSQPEVVAKIRELASALGAASEPCPPDEADLLIVTDAVQVEALLAPAYPSILLLPSGVASFRRILFVVRGHSPDRAALRWLIPLAAHFRASVNLLASAPPPRDGRSMTQYANLLNPASEFGAHLAACRGALATARIDGRVRIRQGHLDADVAAEAGEDDYDLVVVAVETYGAFARRAMSALTDPAIRFRGAVLLVKP